MCYIKSVKKQFYHNELRAVKNTVDNLAGGISYYKPCEVKSPERNVKLYLTLQHLPEILYVSIKLTSLDTVNHYNAFI